MTNMVVAKTASKNEISIASRMVNTTMNKAPTTTTKRMATKWEMKMATKKPCTNQITMRTRIQA